MTAVIRYETPFSTFKSHPRPFIFLAGPTVRGHQQHLQPSWRFAAIESFNKRGFHGSVIVPEFADPAASDKDKNDLPLWEYEGLKIADRILFWVPRTKELIGLTTNAEFGYWLKDRNRVVYGRPDDAYRISYLDILWKRDFAAQGQIGSDLIYNALDDTIAAALKGLCW